MHQEDGKKSDAHGRACVSDLTQKGCFAASTGTHLKMHSSILRRKNSKGLCQCVTHCIGGGAGHLSFLSNAWLVESHMCRILATYQS
jgi:hypothetical protein